MPVLVSPFARQFVTLYHFNTSARYRPPPALYARARMHGCEIKGTTLRLMRVVNACLTRFDNA
jgi:hypothetical protein